MAQKKHNPLQHFLYLYGNFKSKYSCISFEDANRAIKWCEYLESLARRLYSSISNSEMESAKALLNKIQKNEIQDGCLLRDI